MRMRLATLCWAILPKDAEAMPIAVLVCGVQIYDFDGPG